MRIHNHIRNRVWKSIVQKIYQQTWCHVTWPLYKCTITKNMHSFSENEKKKLKVCSNMHFSTRKLVRETIFSKLKYLDLIWAPRGSKGAQNGINVPISSKLATKIYKFGQIWHVIYETWWCYLFLIYSNILPILGHPRGQKG